MNDNTIISRATISARNITANATLLSQSIEVASGVRTISEDGEPIELVHGNADIIVQPKIDNSISAHNENQDAHKELFDAKQDVIGPDSKLPASDIEGLSDVAVSGDYSDLSGTPTKVSDFENDSDFVSESQVNEKLGNYSKTNEFSSVAFSGNYADLSNKPQIPSKTIVEVNAIQTTGIRIAQITVDGQSTDIYADQSGSGTNVQVTETLSSGTKVANILVDGQDNEILVPTIPTNVSSFNNDAGYLVSSDISGLASKNYVDTELAKKQNKIDSSNKLPASSVSGLATVATSGSYNDLINTPTIPSISGLASETYVTNAVSDHNTSAVAHNDIRTDISTINGKIPSAATSQNQLADKAFVNSTINSMAAFFRGTYADQLALLAVQWQTSDPEAQYYVSNNDYAYVQEVVAGSSIGTWDPADHLGEAWRFIYVMGEGWQPQFMVNETPFTQAQLDAINSGITSNLVTQIGTNTTAISGKQDIIDANNKLSASNISGLASVATSGSYSDLSGTPDLSVYAQSNSLATVATSGSYADLSNKPSIPDATSVTQVQSTGTKIATITVGSTSTDIYAPSQTAQVQANWNETNTSAASYIQNKPTIPVVPTNVSSFNNDAGYITKSVNNLDNYTPTSSLATVATTGAYSDLSGTPTIPAAQIQSDWNQTNTSAKDYIKNKPTIPDAQIQSDWNQTNTSAKDYIKNKPTIPACVSSGTSSGTSVTIAADHMTKMSSTSVSSITCTVTSDTTQIHEWAGKFTTGSSQTSVTIAMSNSSTIEWASSPANLISGTKYAFSITGNSTVGYNGTIVPFLY